MWATTATTVIVRSTSPIARIPTGFAFVLRSRNEVKNAADVEKRRQDPDEHNLRRQLERRHSRDESEREPAEHEENRVRDPENRRKDQQRRHGDQQQHEDELVVSAEFHAASLRRSYGAAPRLTRMARRPLVAHVVGARPNYMKVAPVYAELERRGRVEQRLIHTGQHYDAIMKDVFFAELPLPRPHVQLDARTTESALAELEERFRELQPDLVVVAGDVNSTLAARSRLASGGSPCVTSSRVCAATTGRCRRRSTE